MAAAGARALEVSKDDFNEVMPTSLVNVIHSGLQPIRQIIYEYSFDASPEVWLKRPPALHTFFGISSSQKQILALADHAGPLDQIEHYIRRAHARQEAHLPATHMQAIKRAIIGLDQTIRDESGKEIDKGMAERLLELYAELFPASHLEALQQARLAAPLEDEKAKEVREASNFLAANQVFDAIKQNDEKTAAAIEHCKGLVIVRSTKPEVMNDNRYHLNLIHFVFAAFDVLARRGGELPKLEGERYGGWYGKLADRFCFEIIGAVEREFPARMRQILRCGLYYVLGRTKIAERALDIDGVGFLGSVAGSRLGVDSYFDGMPGRMVAGVVGLGRTTRIFQNLLRAITAASKIYYTAGAHSLIAPVCDNVETRRSPAATAAAR